jgi:hypothetical protein
MYSRKYKRQDKLYDQDPYIKEHFSKIARKGVSYNKYRKQVAWRREKVRTYLARGYTQAMISAKLQTSQSTISRDMSIVRNKGVNKVGLTVKSLDEDYSLLKMSMNEQSIKLWEIFDHPKCSIEQKLAIIEILLKIDKRRMELLPLDDVLRELLARESKVAMKEIVWNISQVNSLVDGKRNEYNKI